MSEVISMEFDDGDDLIKELEKYIKEKKFARCIFVSCSGSLKTLTLRYTHPKQGWIKEKFLEPIQINAISGGIFLEGEQVKMMPKIGFKLDSGKMLSGDLVDCKTSAGFQLVIKKLDSKGIIEN